MVNLPNDIYSGGAVQFNSTPYAQFYLNSLARKRAKDEALDNYYNNFSKSINPSGMRTQDIENGWMQKVNDWRDNYQQNKEYIKNPRLDGGRSYNEYMGRYQDIINDIQKSKNLGEISKQYVVPIVGDPNKRTRLRDNGIDAIHRHDLSMYDEGFQQLDPSGLEYGAKPFDIVAQQKLDKAAMQGMKMNNVIEGVTVDPKTKNKITTYKATYSPDDLKTIAGKYVDAFHNDDSFGNSIHDLAHDPNQYDVFNAAFKSTYGRDIQTDEDMAAAYGLNRVQKELSTQKGSAYSPYGPYDYLNVWKAKKDITDADQQDFNYSVDATADRQYKDAQIKQLTHPNNLIYMDADPQALLTLKVDKIALTGDGRLVGVYPNGEMTAPFKLDDYKTMLGKRYVGQKYFHDKNKTEPKPQPKQTGKKKIKDF